MASQDIRLGVGGFDCEKAQKNSLFRKRFLIHASNSLYPVCYKKPFSEVSIYIFRLPARVPQPEQR
jgi:hypothetical protein